MRQREAGFSALADALNKARSNGSALQIMEAIRLRGAAKDALRLSAFEFNVAAAEPQSRQASDRFNEMRPNSASSDLSD